MSSLILRSTHNGVTTLTLNMPKRLNGWTAPMMEALKAGFDDASTDEATRALVLTGTDPYYCAGVNLGATVELGHPRDLHAKIVAHNQALFELFLRFPKPIMIAVNGPAIGGSPPAPKRWREAWRNGWRPTMACSHAPSISPRAGLPTARPVGFGQVRPSTSCCRSTHASRYKWQTVS